MQHAGSSNNSEHSEQEKRADEPQQLSPNALKVAAADCLNSWIFYLQVILNWFQYLISFFCFAYFIDFLINSNY